MDIDSEASHCRRQLGFTGQSAGGYCRFRPRCCRLCSRRAAFAAAADVHLNVQPQCNHTHGQKWVIFATSSSRCGGALLTRNSLKGSMEGLMQDPRRLGSRPVSRDSDARSGHGTAASRICRQAHRASTCAPRRSFPTGDREVGAGDCQCQPFPRNHDRNLGSVRRSTNTDPANHRGHSRRQAVAACQSALRRRNANVVPAASVELTEIAPPWAPTSLGHTQPQAETGRWALVGRGLWLGALDQGVEHDLQSLGCPAGAARNAFFARFSCARSTTDIAALRRGTGNARGCIDSSRDITM